MIQLALAIHQHEASQCCVRTASPSRPDWFKWLKRPSHYTKRHHHIVAFGPLPLAKQSDLRGLRGSNSTRRLSITLLCSHHLRLPSKLNKWCRWIEHYTSRNHHIVAFYPMFPNSRRDFNVLSGSIRTPIWSITALPSHHSFHLGKTT